MAFIKSHNSSSIDLVKDFLVPSGLQVLLYLLIAGLLLVLFNASDIWATVSNNAVGVNEPELEGSGSETGFWDSLTKGRASQIVFWGVIGMVMYSVIWFVWNILTNLRNDMAADDFVHPKTYSRTRYWSAVWGRKGFFAISVFLLVIYAAVFIKLVAVLADLAYSAVDNFAAPESVLKVIAYTVVIAILVHLFALLLRVAANSWRSVYKDL